MLGPCEQHLLWGLRDHFVEDEWEFTRQKTVRIPGKGNSMCKGPEWSEVRWDVSQMSLEGQA